LQWVQLYAIDPPTLQAVLAALRAEFPYVYGFAVSEGVADFYVLAALEPLDFAGLPRLEALPERVRSDLARVGVHSTAELWSLLRLGPADVDRLVATAPAVNRDDNLFVELRSPWNLYGSDSDATFALIDEQGSGILPLLAGSPAATDPEVLGELALAYARARGAPRIARQLLEQADAAGPSAHADAARAVLGALFGDVGPEGRRALLDGALEQNPNAAAVRDLRARLRADTGDLDGALADVDAELVARPEHAPARLLRVQILYALGRHAEAAAECDRLLATEWAALQPNAWLFAGQTYLEVGRPEDAAANLERYVEAEPGWHVAWERLGLAYERAGRADDAARARRNQGRNLWLLAQTARERGDLPRAFALLRQALALDPGHAPTRATLAELEERWAKSTGGAPTP
jgi:tetratricopeptide (TPR) repeat protein